jgi:hypothetical protein
MLKKFSGFILMDAHKRTLLFSIIFVLGISGLLVYNRIDKYLWKEYIVSSIDKQLYLVKKDKDASKKADILATLNKNISRLIDHIKTDKSSKFDKNKQLLISRFKSGSITENIFTSEATAFTVNKGEEISFCLKTSQNEIIYDINTLTFVAIHELAHIGCESVGHTKEFVLFFIFLLQEAIKINVYKYVDYSKTPVDYCGVLINETPIPSVNKDFF